MGTEIYIICPSKNQSILTFSGIRTGQKERPKYWQIIYEPSFDTCLRLLHNNTVNKSYQL